MGILSRALRRSLDDNTAGSLVSYLRGLGGLWQTATGVTVTPESSLATSAVYACVRVLAESVASLPLFVYRRSADGGKERASDHYLYPVLHDIANPEMTSFIWRETTMTHLCLWGNAYSEIEETRGGQITALWPMRPDKVMPRRNEKKKIEYVVEIPNGAPVVLPAERVLHLRGLGINGLVGLSPIQLARQAIGLGLAAEEFGARFFGNNATPGVVLKHPGSLKDTAYNRIKENWAKQHEGLNNAQRTAILEEGMTIEKIGIPPNDAQFLETRKWQVTEIARWYRMPPHMIGDLEKATFSNIEHQGLDFVVNTLRPWLVRIEQGMYMSLLTPTERKAIFAEFLVDGMLRGDIAARYQAYSVGRNWGWLNVDEIRERENMNPLPDGAGKVYLTPLNMSTGAGEMGSGGDGDMEPLPNPPRKRGGSRRGEGAEGR